MKSLSVLFNLCLISVILSSCGGSTDCSCEEINVHDGKWYQSGLHKDSDQVKLGELFTGTCETLNDAGEVIESGTFENGFAIERKTWREIDGKLYPTLDMNYDNNKYHNGFRMEYQHDFGLLCTKEYHEYKDGKDIAWYALSGDGAKTWMIGDAADGSIDLGDFMDERPCIFRGHSGENGKFLAFLECLQNENLPRFTVVNLENVVSESKEVESEDESSFVEDEEYEEEYIEPVEEVEYYQINDPDGYSNLRKTPGGDILQKVYEGEQFEVLGEEDDHKKVKLTDGTVGYIHKSRVIKK